MRDVKLQANQIKTPSVERLLANKLIQKSLGVDRLKGNGRSTLVGGRRHSPTAQPRC